jgi:hypothetical protein
MGPLLVNTKQKVAVLASGLAIAATGFVAPGAAASSSPTTGDDDHPTQTAQVQQPDDR